MSNYTSTNREGNMTSINITAKFDLTFVLHLTQFMCSMLEKNSCVLICCFSLWEKCLNLLEEAHSKGNDITLHLTEPNRVFYCIVPKQEN